MLKSNGTDFPLRDRIRPVNNILTFPSGFLYSTLLRMAGSKITGRNLHFRKLDRYEHMINQSDSMT